MNKVSAQLRVEEGATSADLTPLCDFLDLPQDFLQAVEAKEDRNRLVTDIQDLMDQFVASSPAEEMHIVSSLSELIQASAVDYGVPLDETCGIAVDLAQGTMARLVQMAIDNEATGNIMDAKRKLQDTIRLPNIVTALSEAFPAVPSEVALKSIISEEEELKLSEFCWELEDSGEDQNEALAATLLKLLGLRK